MSEVKRIGSQLKRAFAGQAWHGPSLQELLADVTFEQAAARPFPNIHSIWELVLHLEAWTRTVTQCLEGQIMPEQLPMEENWPQGESASETAWRGALAKLENGQRKLRDALRNLTDEKLEQIVPGRPYSFYFMLHGTIQHILYHAGQIALLKKVLN
jgi:uncharacterized damage-inducible protein DinB